MSELMITLKDGLNKVHTFEVDSGEFLADIYFRLCESHHAKLINTLNPPEPARDEKPEPGKVYRLTGDSDTPSIARGDKLTDCEVDKKPAEPARDDKAFMDSLGDLMSQV